jgi:hypothetical protein
MSPPFSGSKNKPSKKPARKQLQADCLLCSSETQVDFQRTTRRNILEDWTLHNHRCQNLKSYTNNIYYVKPFIVVSSPEKETGLTFTLYVN